jgi:hypothetical protein
MKTKVCSICKQTKNITDFHKKETGKCGVASWCKNGYCPHKGKTNE